MNQNPNPGKNRRGPQSVPNGIMAAHPTTNGNGFLPGRADSSPAGMHQSGARRAGNGEFWPFADLLLAKWYWLALGGVAFGAIGLIASLAFLKTSYTAPVQILRYDSPNAAEVFGYRQSTPETLASMLRSPDLLRTVALKSDPPVSEETIASSLKVIPTRDSDIIVAALPGKTPQAAVDLANLYARQAVEFTRDMQARAAGEVGGFANHQLQRVESEITNLSRSSRIDPPIMVAAGGAVMVAAPRDSRLVEKLQHAREDLVDLLARYTDAHPLVQAQRAKIAVLEQQFASVPAPAIHAAANAAPVAASAPASAPGTAIDPDIVRSQMQSLQTERLALSSRREAAQTLAANPPGYCQVLAPATVRDATKHGRRAKVLCCAILLGLFGVLGGAASVVYGEAADDRLRSIPDVTRVTNLPVLATAGDFRKMTPADEEKWAFRSWVRLQSGLGGAPDCGLVCGVTSAQRGEGRTTWVKSMARAASKCGFRVLTIATRPDAGRGSNNGIFIAEGGESEQPTDESVAVAGDTLTALEEVTQSLTGPNAQPVVHIPLPGWVWNLERRKQWKEALHHWSLIENIVILVELPPASEHETVLLAESLPNLIWLTDSGRATATDTRDQLDILRHARCRLAGAVLNHAPRPILQRRLSRWLACSLLLALLPVGSIRADDVIPPTGFATNKPVTTNLTLAAAAPMPRAAWQQRLTLGPGDVLNIALYGEPDLARAAVPVGPDGRVSFLEAQNVIATGLTIDELRARMDDELAKYRRAPRTIVSPVAFRSKKYFVLGGVARRGAFTLDRPTTIIDAVAQAGGLATGWSSQAAVEVADLSRSFLARQGARVPLDFEKLFQNGDLSQNIPLEPGDYLYFPMEDQNEVYVLGAVTYPGSVTFHKNLSVIEAISVRGGFTQAAWKRRILIVRGSLSHPQTHIVLAPDTLAARAPDLALQPHDIIFVSRRPWIKAEELLDAATSAFIESAVITWTGFRAGF